MGWVEQPLNPELQHQVKNKIDQMMKQAKLHAEKQCQKIHTGKVPCSYTGSHASISKDHLKACSRRAD